MAFWANKGTEDAEELIRFPSPTLSPVYSGHPPPTTHPSIICDMVAKDDLPPKAQATASSSSPLLGATLPPSFFFRSNPVVLFFSDIYLVLSKFTSLPNILLPLYTGPDQLPSAELDVRDPRNLFAVVHQVVLFAFSVVAVNGAVALFVIGSPTLLLAAWVAGWWVAFELDKWLTQGDGSALINPKGEWDKEGKYGKETWLYVNGICTDRRWATSNVTMLRDLFDRRVLGIHNRTVGFLFDLVECVIQRDWVFGTQDATPLLYTRLREALLDCTKTKVVLIAHSQGGIIASLVVDWLISDLPHSALQKLEVYTFACAANHFNSPIGSDGRPVLPVIEHFANGKDPVAGIGVLAWRDAPNDKCVAGLQHERFAGKLFLRPTVSGHLLNQHYLESRRPDTVWPNDVLDNKPAHLWSYLKK